MTVSTFERLILLKRIPYWIYWPGLGFVLLVVLELTSRAAGVHLDLGARFFVLFLPGIPAAVIRLKRYFRWTLVSVSALLWEDKSLFEQWLSKRERQVFTLCYWPARIMTGSIIALEFATIFILGLPYRSSLSILPELIAFSVVFWVCAQSVYIVVGTMWILYEVSKRMVKLPFFYPPVRAISPLLNYYANQTLVMTIYYLVLAISVWLSPYGLNAAMLIWLAVLALFPLGVLFISISMIHAMVIRTKEANIQRVNSLIQEALLDTSRNKKAAASEKLETLMSVQVKVQSMQEWPFVPAGAATLVITVVTASAQVAVAIMQANGRSL